MNEFDFDPYANLPDEPEAAFLRLEAYFKAECDRRLEQARQDERTDVIFVDYIAQVPKAGIIKAAGAIKARDNAPSATMIIRRTAPSSVSLRSNLKAVVLKASTSSICVREKDAQGTAP